jgi:hypothetical protein
MATTSSSPSYLGETSRRSSQIEVPLIAARRQHLITRALQAVTAVLLVLAGGLFVWWKMRPTVTLQPAAAAPVAAAPAPAPIPVAAAPAPAVPPVAAAPVAAAPPVAVPSAPVAAVPGAPVPSMLPARPRPLAKPGDAHITVASDPRCEVLVDGVPYGATPLIDLAVPAGKHMITLLNSQAGIKEVQRVTLATGQLWTRSFNLGSDGKLASNASISAKMLTASPQPVPVAPAPVPAPVPAAPAHKDEPATHPKPVEGSASGGAVATAPTPKPTPAPSPSAAPAPPATPPVPAARTVAGFVLDAQKINNTQPHLPDFVSDRNRGKKLVGMYKICVSKDGRVYDVSTVASISGADATIIGTIKGWSYKPQPVNTCATKTLSFQVP